MMDKHVLNAGYNSVPRMPYCSEVGYLREEINISSGNVTNCIKEPMLKPRL
jgi:hypothetical protein